MSYGDVKGNFNNETKMEPEYLRKLFLGGLSFSTTEETLREHFSKWGEIVDCVVMKHPNTTQSRGFGFVTYSHSSMVDECQQNRPHRIDNRNIEPKRAIPRDLIGEISSEANIRKLFIGGLRDDITENDLREYFSQFGNITDCLLAVERDTQKPRGFGFVEFDDYDPTDKIVLQKVHEIKGKKVNVKKAISKTEMQNKKSSNWQNDGGMGNGYGGNRAMGNGYGHGGPGGNPNYNQGYGSGGGGGGWNNNAGGGGGAGGPPVWNNANAPVWNSGWNNGNQGGGPGPMRGGYQNNRPAPYRKRN